MIGAIVLTLRHRKDIKRQNVLAQMYRDPAKAMDLVDVKPGRGGKDNGRMPRKEPKMLTGRCGRSAGS
jgi:hypothetical protein